ncbi:MAG: hypothetical protein ACPG74_07950, partial [Candidatus Puniceispirillaceae bacterium]
MGYQHWRYSKDATQTGWLEIDVKDSSVNVLRKQVMLEWADILKEISADGDLKALCFLSGKPGGFVYGADIAEFEELKTPDDVHQLIELADQVGLDVCYDVGRVLGMPEAAQTALKAKIDASMLGRKTGSG